MTDKEKEIAEIISFLFFRTSECDILNGFHETLGRLKFVHLNNLVQMHMAVAQEIVFVINSER